MAEKNQPTSAYLARYRGDGVVEPKDGRLHAPTFSRIGPPVLAALAHWLSSASGAVLEIGAGTGQHAAAFSLAFERLDWWPSDPDAIHRASILAWQKALRLPKRAPLALDAASDWAADADIAGLVPLTAVISMNVIHIAPFAVTEGIVAGAGRTLGAGGLLIFYGPFRENGEHTGDGNVAFDAGLRGENAAWGVRDTGEISALARQAGLNFAALIAMPTNNRLLIFRRP